MSIIESILKPYKILFKDSKEQPKEIGIKPEAGKAEEKTVEEVISVKPKPVEQPRPAEPASLGSKPRAGKVLWKKK